MATSYLKCHIDVCDGSAKISERMISSRGVPMHNDNKDANT